MTDKDVVFKNPYRGRRVAQSEPYQPEYERLNAAPVKYPVNQDDVKNFIDKTKTEKPQKRPIVQSGNNEDLIWTQGLEQEPRDIPEEPRLPEKESYMNVQEDIEDDIGLDGAFSLDAMAPGDVVLLHGSDVIRVGSERDIKESLADLLAAEEGELDDFVVLKRLNVKIGIFIDD